MLAFHNYTYRLNCKHQFTYLQTIAKLRTFLQKSWMVLIYVITSLCRKCPYKHIFIIISPFVRKNGVDNSLKQKLIKQKSSTAILQYCSFILCLKWVTANSFYEMSPRLIIYYLSYLILTCKNKK